jgi:hypothetical protein
MHHKKTSQQKFGAVSSIDHSLESFALSLKSIVEQKTTVV